MGKLTYKEILDILKENIPARLLITDDYEDEDDNEFVYPESVENSEEIKHHQDKLEIAQRLIDTHVGRNDYDKRDDEFHELINKWSELCDTNIKLQVYLKELGIGQMVEVQQKGGSDQGSEWYSVRHFVDHDVYIKFNYYYSSYEGIDIEEGEYDDCQNVEPAEKVIIVYNLKKE